MSFQLVDEVLDHAPADLTPAERLVLVALASLMPARKVWSVPAHVLERRTGLGRGLSDVFQRLARRGCDPRVPIGTGKNGRPFYTVPGESPRYLLPRFPAPPDCRCEVCVKLQLAEGAVTTEPSDSQLSQGAVVTAAASVVTAPAAVTTAPGAVRTAPKPDQSRPAHGPRRSAGARRGRAPQNQTPTPPRTTTNVSAPAAGPRQPTVNPGERAAEEFFAELRRRTPANLRRPQMVELLEGTETVAAQGEQ